MTIHTFGAYFGLVLSRVLYKPHLEKSKHRQGSVYHSDLFAMIGEVCWRWGGMERGYFLMPTWETWDKFLDLAWPSSPE